GVGRCGFRVDLVCCLVAGFHDLLREGAQSRTTGEEALQRRRVHSIVFGDHPAAGIARCRQHGRLVVSWQTIPSVQVDEGLDVCPAPPPGVVVTIERATRAVRLSPLDPFTFLAHTIIGAGHFYAGRHDEACWWAEKGLWQQPNSAAAARVAAASHAL